MNTTEDIKAHFDCLPKHEARNYIFNILDTAVVLMGQLDKSTNVVDDTAWLKLKALLGAPAIDEGS